MNDASEKQETNTFRATVYKVQTLIDGGIRVTLDLPETGIESAAWLMNCKRVERPLIIIADVEALDPLQSILSVK